MSNNYVFTKQLAEELLDVALKYDEVDKFIIGYPGYEVKVNDGIGNSVTSVDAIMQAFYKKHSVDNSIGHKLYNAIESGLNGTKNGITMLLLIDIIRYQMREEKQNNATFKLDCIALLDLVKANILRNKETYSRPFKEYKSGFMESFTDVSKNLERVCGYKLL